MGVYRELRCKRVYRMKEFEGEVRLPHQFEDVCICQETDSFRLCFVQPYAFFRMTMRLLQLFPNLVISAVNACLETPIGSS
jgi:hypothetical protein